MKRLLRADIELPIDISKIDIQSIIFVDNAEEYYPRNDYYVSAAKGTKINYSSLDREGLLKMPKKVLNSIHDVNVLRKLKYDELTLQQQREVTLKNKDNFLTKQSDVESILKKLKDCGAVYISPSAKNNTFRTDLRKLGAKLTDEDASEIVSNLKLSDYSNSTYSYLDKNWNALLLIFEYTGSHTFSSVTKGNDPVEVTNMDIYIKIDVDNESDEGYAAMSFHHPEFVMNHPYK